MFTLKIQAAKLFGQTSHNPSYHIFKPKQSRHKCCQFEKIEKDFLISQLLPFVFFAVDQASIDALRNVLVDVLYYKQC